MKRSIIASVIALAGILSPQILQAQGTMTYLSNLGQPPDGTNAVGSDSWLAEMFGTGTNASGYELDSVQLAMADASGSPSGFMVMLFGMNSNNAGAILPGSSLGTLNGALSPVTGGIYTFTSASNLMLSPSRSYFIVVTAGTTVANGAYQSSFMNTASYISSEGWAGGLTFISVNGGSFWRATGAGNPQFAINAIAIPEPGVLGLFALGGLLLAWRRWRKVPLRNALP